MSIDRLLNGNILNPDFEDTSMAIVKAIFLAPLMNMFIETGIAKSRLASRFGPTSRKHCYLREYKYSLFKNFYFVRRNYLLITIVGFQGTIPF